MLMEKTMTTMTTMTKTTKMTSSDSVCYRKRRILPYRACDLYALAADVTHYPDFVPWCRAVRILKRARTQNGTVTFTAEVTIGYNLATRSFCSQDYLYPAQQQHDTWRIEAYGVDEVKSPFTHLYNRWLFKPKAKGTEVEFYIEYALRSSWIASLLTLMFDNAAVTMIHAFEKRAQDTLD